MIVEYVCDRNVVCIDHLAPVVQAAQLLHERNVSELVITKEEEGKLKPIGLLSERDIVIHGVAKAATRLGELQVAQLMVGDLPAVCSTDFVRDVVQRMSQMMLRRLPVVDEAGAPFGIVRVEHLLELVVDQHRMSLRQKRGEGEAQNLRAGRW